MGFGVLSRSRGRSPGGMYACQVDTMHVSLVISNRHDNSNDRQTTGEAALIRERPGGGAETTALHHTTNLSPKK